MHTKENITTTTLTLLLKEIGLKDTCNDFGLCKNNFLSDSSLPLIQLLTDAGNHTQTTLKSMSNLLTNELTGKTNTSLK